MAVPGTVEGDGNEAVSSPGGTAVSGTNLKVATRPAVVGPAWFDAFHPGAPTTPSTQARVRVVADVVGALTQIHNNSGLPREHRRHGRLTPRHVLIGVDGTASLFDAKQPFSKLLPPQPDLGYLAPELLTQSGPSDQRSDVFSIGVLLWEALDNGRLFPHHRAAAISRLIARKALPSPRVNDEWALPLVDVAQKALNAEPQDRYQSATELWLALREHLPAPDKAREELSLLAQRTLKLQLTGDIRPAPPYISSAPASVVFSMPVPPGPSIRPGALDTTRYSLPVERSSLVPRSQRPAVSEKPLPASSLPPLDWNSLMPAASSRPLASGSLPPESLPPASRTSYGPRNSRAPQAQRVSSAPPESLARVSSAPRLEAMRASHAPHAEPVRPSHAPRADVRSSHPPAAPELAAPLADYASRASWTPESAPPSQAGSHWLALALVIVAFVGVGVGAVVFGAGSVLAPKLGADVHPPQAVAPVVLPPQQPALQAQALAATPGAPAANPAPSGPGSPPASDVAQHAPPKPRPARPVKKVAPRPKASAPAATAASAAPPEASEPAPPAEPPNPATESLPFVTEPWGNKPN